MEEDKTIGGDEHRMRKNMQPRVFIYLIILLMVLSLPATVKAEDEEAGNGSSQSPQVSASAAILMDRVSGRVLYGKNSRRELPMASTTKIMTALVALENGRMDDIVITSKEAAETGGSSIYLGEGELKTLDELLYGLMLRSGNDAGVAIAEHIAGSVEEFAGMMNEKAREIGALHTNFVNPHGLHDDDHYTTAYDLALITSYALNNRYFASLVSTPRAIISWPGEEWDRVLHNHNKLLELYEGGDGVKTGWTTPAGRCIVGSATRNGWQLVMVLLDAEDMWEDAEILLDFGFDNYKLHPLLLSDRVIKTVEVKSALQEWGNIATIENFYYPLREGEESLLRYRFHLAEPYVAPLHIGDKVGSIEAYLKNESLGRVDLVITESIPRANIFQRIINFFTNRGN